MKFKKKLGLVTYNSFERVHQNEKIFNNIKRVKLVEFHDIEEINSQFNGEYVDGSTTKVNPMMIDFKLL